MGIPKPLVGLKRYVKLFSSFTAPQNDFLFLLHINILLQLFSFFSSRKTPFFSTHVYYWTIKLVNPIDQGSANYSLQVKYSSHLFL